jgi:hypothetical protein
MLTIMKRDQVARLIGGSFGLVFIEANASALPTAAAIPLRILAIAVFLGRVVFGRRLGGPGARGDETATPGFGRRYWYVVAIEVLGIIGGLVVINRVLHAPRATVPWIAFVVGVHFFGLAAAWRRSLLRGLGASVAACGAAGLVLTLCGASAAVIALVAGVAPGALLLASVSWPGRARGGSLAVPNQTAG